MPHDNSINQDVIESGRLHVVMSKASFRYGEKDPRIFSFATPKDIARVYARINDPETGIVPRPERIVEDVHKVVHALQEIYKSEGAFVPGLAGGRVPGHRNTDAWLKTSNNWGGKHTRKEFELKLATKGMHADLKDLLNDPERDITAVFRRDDLDDVGTAEA